MFAPLQWRQAAKKKRSRVMAISYSVGSRQASIANEGWKGVPTTLSAGGRHIGCPPSRYYRSLQLGTQLTAKRKALQGKRQT